MMVNSRQDRIREQIESLPMGSFITLNLYPKELKRFKSYYRSFSFEIIDTKEGKNYKMYQVRISL